MKPRQLSAGFLHINFTLPSLIRISRTLSDIEAEDTVADNMDELHFGQHDINNNGIGKRIAIPPRLTHQLSRHSRQHSSPISANYLLQVDPRNSYYGGAAAHR